MHHLSHRVTATAATAAAAMAAVSTTAKLQSHVIRRHMSSASFAEMFRRSVDNVAVSPGDILQGHVVGSFSPGSTSSRFHLVDFGLKEEAVLTPRELSGRTAIGDALAMPLVQLEDDFNEPTFDFDRRSQIATLQAERFELLTRSLVNANKKVDPSSPRLVYGRFTRFNRGGASAKILGVDAFVPRHHVLALERPVLGAFTPFYVLSITAGQSDATSNITSTASSSSKTISSQNATYLDVFPVVSSYGGVLLCLANLVAFDDAWKASGGGSSRERLAYLRLLTRVLQQKNPMVRRMLPQNINSYEDQRFGQSQKRFHQQRRAPKQQFMEQDGIPQSMRMRRQSSRRASNDNYDTAWLNELPTGSWQSSGKNRVSTSITGKSPAIHNILRKQRSRIIPLKDHSKGSEGNRRRE